MSGANASPIGRSHQEMSGANASPTRSASARVAQARQGAALREARSLKIGRSHQETMKLWNRTQLLIGIIALIAAAPLLGYVSRKSVVTGGQIVINKWALSSFPITWRMNPTRSPNVAGAGDVESAFLQAFQAWSAISTATITFAEGQPAEASVKPGDRKSVV